MELLAAKHVAVGTGPGGEENMKIAQIAPLKELEVLKAIRRFADQELVELA